MIRKIWKKDFICKTAFAAALFFFILFALYEADIQTIFVWDHETGVLDQDKVRIENTLWEQSLKCRGNTLYMINMYFENVDELKNGKIYVRLMDGEEEICSWEKMTSELENNGYTQFELPELLGNVQNRDLWFSVGCDETAEGIEISDVEYIYGRIGRKVIYGGLLLAVSGIMAVAFFVGTSNKMKLEQKYLGLALTVGICYLLFLPLSQLPDDLFHFARIWDVAEGNMVSDLKGTQAGGMLPGNLYAGLEFGSEYSDIYTNSWQEIDMENYQWYIFPNTALYSPVAYIPEVLGIWIGRLFTKNVLMISLLGRLAGFLFGVAVVYQAVRKAPYKKYGIVLIAMLPVFLQEGTALGTDCFVNSVILCFVAYLLWLIREKGERMDGKRMVFLSVLSMCVAMCKVVYLPFCLLLLLIPKDRFADSKSALIFKAGNLAAAIAANLLWLAATAGFIDGFSGRSDSSGQILYILMHPFSYCRVIYNTIAMQGHDLLFGAFGSDLGWVGNIDVNRLMIIGLVILFVLTAMCGYPDSIQAGKREKAVLGFVILTVTVLTFTSLYVQFTSVANPVIDGLQGRYFIPLLFPVSVIAGEKLILKDKKNYDAYFFPFLGYVHAVVIIAIVKSLAV